MPLSDMLHHERPKRSSLIPDSDLHVSRWPAQRPGGQQVGEGGAGVEVEHLPTGLVARVMTQHSQARNREIAVHMIEAALTHPKFEG